MTLGQTPRYPWLKCSKCNNKNECRCSLGSLFQNNVDKLLTTLGSLPDLEKNFIPVVDSASVPAKDASENEDVESTYYLERWAKVMNDFWSIDEKIDKEKFLTSQYF